MEHLVAEGFPTEADPYFKEHSVNDLVLRIIVPIIADFIRMTGRKMTLVREKEIISEDSDTGGYEEFIMVDTISVNESEDKYVLVVE